MIPLLRRVLVSLVARLCRLCKSWSAWLWSSLLTRHRGHVRRMRANHDPGPASEDRTELGPGQREAQVDWQVATVTPAPLSSWKDILSKLQKRVPKCPMEFKILPAAPETGFRRYKPRTAKK